MKFLSKVDAQKFLAEVEVFDKINSVDEKYQPTKEELSGFLKRRTPLVKSVKNHRKSSAQKGNWRKNRGKMMKGIKAFHKSTDGKRFHKKLGRFIATRVFRKKETSEDTFTLLMAKQGVLKGINAARQHLLVELEYYHPYQEQIELEEFLVDYAFPYFRLLEKKIICDQDLDCDELCFMMDITENNAVLQKVSEISSREFAQIEKMWNSIVGGLSKDGLSEESDNYYSNLFTNFRDEIRKNNAKS